MLAHAGGLVGSIPSLCPGSLPGCLRLLRFRRLNQPAIIGSQVHTLRGPQSAMIVRLQLGVE